MVSGLLLTVLAIAYLGLLFAVAFFGERKSVYPGRERLRPYIYSLALGVYCTTWTFFGAVGTAVRDGWAYLPIYLGPRARVRVRDAPAAAPGRRRAG